MSVLYLQQPGIVCALGADCASVWSQLLRTDAPGGSAQSRACSEDRSLHLGFAAGDWSAPTDVPAALRSRNNGLLDAALVQMHEALEALRCAHPATRIGVAIGSSTSGIAEGESAVRARTESGRFPPGYHFGQQDLYSPADFIARRIGACGPSMTISTACSSGAKALASAARWIRAGICDAVVCGGADSLCSFTVAGFRALESVSAERCNPCSRNRNGINIGEGAALFVLSRVPSPVRLAGWGESSDAHHISAPEPEGRGAEAAMRQALTRAGLTPAAVDYINLHGTATQQNDLAESLAVHRVFAERPWCSSSKPLTGHALGAAGAIEAALCWLTLQPDNGDGWLPPHWWDGAVDPALAPLRLAEPGTTLGRRPGHVLSNSFAFGGNNASLLLSAE